MPYTWFCDRAIFFKKYIIPIEILFYQCFPSIINEIINALSFLQKEVIAVSLSIIQKMNEMLLTEMPEYRAQAAEIGVSGEQRRLLRALMNVRPPRPLSEDFLVLQDQLLSAERETRGVVDVMALPSVTSDARIVPSMLRAADCVLIVPARHVLRIAIP